VIQSLLNHAGLEEAAFSRVFGTAAATSFPELEKLVECGLVHREDGCWRLTPLGFELADAIGPALYSAASRARLEAFAQP
jgi:coproporphyrinogen III oxidase-like Fe-S oxidoreductase